MGNCRSAHSDREVRLVLVSVSENAPGCRHRRGAIRGYDSGSLLSCRRYEHSGARRGMHANERQYIVAIVGTPRFGSLRCLGAYLLISTSVRACALLKALSIALISSRWARTSLSSSLHSPVVTVSIRTPLFMDVAAVYPTTTT